MRREKERENERKIDRDEREEREGVRKRERETERDRIQKHVSRKFENNTERYNIIAPMNLRSVE